MIEQRSGDEIFLEDKPDFHMDDRDVQFCVRPGDVLQNPGQWEKQKGLLDRYPKDKIAIFHGGYPVAEVSKGGSIVVNCEEVSNEVGVVLAGNMRFNPNTAVRGSDLSRKAEVMRRFQRDIARTLTLYFSHSYLLLDFLAGHRDIDLSFQEELFHEIDLCGIYGYLHEIGPLMDSKYLAMRAGKLSQQEVLNLKRLEWLRDLRKSIGLAILEYCKSHVTADCHVANGGPEADFARQYLSRMLIRWRFPARVNCLVAKVAFPLDSRSLYKLDSVRFTP